MAKFQSPLLGYNNNVRHRGRVFHIQTEDSGVNHPHIITHLFMDGGRILKSVKRSYAEHVGSDKMSETVRLLMKEQHKAMFIALRDGEFDELVENAKRPSGTMAAAAPQKTAPKEREEKDASPPAAAPEPKEAAQDAAAATKGDASKADPPKAVEAPRADQVEAPRADQVEASRADQKDAPAIAARSADDAAAAPPETAPPNPDRIPSFIEELAPDTTSDERRSEVDVPPPTDSDESLPVVELGPIDAAAEAPAVEPPPNTTRDPEKRTASVAELTLDFDALERDSQGGASPYLPANDLPPPPQNLFAKEPRTATYSAVEPNNHHDRLQPSHRPASPAHGAPAAHPPTTQKPPSEGRYAPARPAAIFGAASKQASPSVFSDDLISDKSLDEVILSYLAEDLDPPRRE